MRHRILSLIPSCTEMVCALGRGAELVGRSHECDYPSETASVPVCTNPLAVADELGGDMEEFDYSNSRWAPTLNLPLIEDLQPDIILSRGGGREITKNGGGTRLESPVNVIVPLPARLADLWTNIQIVAGALDGMDEVRAVIKQLKNRLVDVIEKVAALPDRPRVACIEWPEPLMVAGRWIPDVVEMAGGINLFSEAGKNSPAVSPAELFRQDPEAVVFMPRGSDLAGARRRAMPVSWTPAVAEWRSSRADRLWAADGRHYFHRPGPRLVEAVEIMAELLHPDQFDFGHGGRGWERL